MLNIFLDATLSSAWRTVYCLGLKDSSICGYSSSLPFMLQVQANVFDIHQFSA